MIHLQETLINRPYDRTGRVLFSFFQALRARPPSQAAARPPARGLRNHLCGRDVGFVESGYPRFNPFGIIA
jgi:hypothetical protein